MIYTPREDSYLIEKAVRRYSKDKKVLDLGTGSGILAIAALNSGASDVFASDINITALKSIKNNKIKKIHSDLFENISEKFDLIVCNPPYLPADEREDKESALITTGGRKGDEFLIKFIKIANKHLEKNGKILILISSLTPKKNINDLLIKLKFKKEIIENEKVFFEKLQVWLLQKDF